MKAFLPLVIVGLFLVGFIAQPRARDAAVSMPGMANPASSSSPSGAGDPAMSMGPHMKMLHSNLPPSAQDIARAGAILQTLRAALSRYSDYRTAERDGYVQFLPEVPQKIYHFTRWANAVAAEFTFNPAKPTSLMYERTPDGYRLVGAMYTAPAGSSPEALNARVPLTLGTWHEHVNVCFPPRGEAGLMLEPHAQFGLAGSIATAEACSAVGGTFKPLIFNWMLHVWPYETQTAKIWKATAG